MNLTARGTWLGVATAGVLISAVLPGGPASARVVDSVTLTALSVDHASVAPVGLVPQNVTVTAHLVSTQPLDPQCVPNVSGVASGGGPYVTLVRTSEAAPAVVGRVPASSRVDLHLAAGTTLDGDWSATFAVPSTWTGTWQVGAIFACSPDSATIPLPPHQYAFGTLALNVDPRTIGHTVNVTAAGTHLPSLSLGYTPDPISYAASAYTIKGRLTDSTTGVGLAGVSLYGCVDVHCGAAGSYQPVTLTTNASGYYAWATVGVNQVRRIDMWSPTSPPANTFFADERVVAAMTIVGPRPVVQPAISAAPDATVLATGATSSINGKVWGRSAGAVIQVQYLVGATAWRLAATGELRSSGRWTIVFPTRAGRVTYRAYLPAAPPAIPGPGGKAAASSRPFVVTGT